MLTEDQIDENWELFLENLVEVCDEERAAILLDFYKSREDEIGTMPASSNTGYHSAFPGGYVYHVNKVVECCYYLYKVWEGQDAVEGFTYEELIFAAIHHDLGKIGTLEHELYIQTDDNWKNNRGEYYDHNNQIEYMTVPDRSLFLLQQLGITLSQNEWVAIKTHDGLYDDANKAYLFTRMAENKPRTNISYILHQADMIAARAEFSGQWLKKFTEKSKPKQVEAQVNSKLKHQLNNM